MCLFFRFNQTRMSLDTGDGPGKIFPGLDSLMSHSRNSQPREQSNGPKAPVAKLFEQGIYYLFAVSRE